MGTMDSDSELNIKKTGGVLQRAPTIMFHGLLIL